MARRATRFVPPHCPAPDCDSHADPEGWRFKKKGFYSRQQGPRRVQRYRCQHCGRNFSTQTFAVDYWLKTPKLVKAVFWGLVNSACLRQLARAHGVRHATVQRLAERLGRHCLLLHEALRPRDAPAEPLVLDGFRSLESGRSWPFDLHLLVGMSHYVYGCNEAELRRSGRKTSKQRAKWAQLEARFGRPDPRATRRAVRELLERSLPAGAEVEIHTDDHPAYRQAFRALRQRTLHHRVTSSRAVRTPRNPLFPVNLADLWLRHSSANHKRQTIAFSKRRQGAMYRAAIWLVWRNYMQSRSERRRDAPPGVTVGAIPRALALGDVLRRRRFPWRTELTGWLRDCYYGRIPTRPIPNAREHRRVYAV